MTYRYLPKEKLTIDLPKELKDELRDYVKGTNRSMNEVAVAAIERFLWPYTEVKKGA